MSDYYDIKKLCSISRIEIDESKIQQTTEKIKEIISFFNKLDEFELNEKGDNDTYGNLPQSIPTTSTSDIDNYIKFEKKINDLRDDSNDENNNYTSLFSFRFHNNKNGYVIGPRI